MRRLLQELFVPFFVLAGSAIYWLSLDGAPSISKRIPVGVICLVVALSIAIIIQSLIELRKQGHGDRSESYSFNKLPSNWWQDWYKRLALIALSILYYFAFNHLGFSLANFLFLVAALTSAGFTRGKGKLAAVGKTLGAAFVASAIFYCLATIMEFNVPKGPLGL